MKFAAIIIGTLLAPPAFAINACYYGDKLVEIDSKATFYYVDESAKIGPAYTCAELSRVRTCEPFGDDAVWSDVQPECSQEDSGGCVDRWLDRLPDSAFTFTQCR